MKKFKEFMSDKIEIPIWYFTLMSIILLLCGTTLLIK